MVSIINNIINKKIKKICNIIDPYNDNINNENTINIEYLRYIYYQCDRNNISEKNCQFILNEINKLNKLN